MLCPEPVLRFVGIEVGGLHGEPEHPQSGDCQHAGEHLVGEFRGVAFKPIEFNLDGLKRSTVIPDVLSFEIEGVTPRNRPDQPMYLDNTAHPVNRRLALARSKETHLHGFGLDLDIVGKDNNGHFAPFAWAA